MGTMWCVKCQMEQVAAKRVEAGFITCLRCGEADAKKVRHTVVPMHKSNYVVISDRRDLMGINNKGGFYR
jgi:ribosomal protein L37AE/L43A